MGLAASTSARAAELKSQSLPPEGGSATRYWLGVPDGAAPDGGWPLVLFLHGAGERGENLDQVKVHGPPKQAVAARAFPFILVAPQCPEGRWWDSEELIRLLDHLEKTQSVDADRIYVTGLSMGGFGSWNLAVAQPRRFAALAPICGGGDPSKASAIAHIPAWVFHGERDPVVPADRSREMVEALKAAGGSPKYTEYPDVQHNAWDPAYADPAFYEWLLQQRRPKG